MPELNTDIPYLSCLIRRSYYTHNPDHDNIFDNAVAFGVQCVTNRIITFHVMFDFGMVRSRVPISALYWKTPERDIEPHMKLLWDAFGEQFSITQFDYLKGKRCSIILKDKSYIWATYCFTIDWWGNSFSENPSDYKNCHICMADDGYFVGMPNNRMIWKDMNWVTKDFPVPLKDIKVDKEFIRVETFSDRWVTEEGDNFYYDITKPPTS